MCDNKFDEMHFGWKFVRSVDVLLFEWQSMEKLFLWMPLLWAKVNVIPHARNKYCKVRCEITAEILFKYCKSSIYSLILMHAIDHVTLTVAQLHIHTAASHPHNWIHFFTHKMTHFESEKKESNFFCIAHFQNW